MGEMFMGKTGWKRRERDICRPPGSRKYRVWPEVFSCARAATMIGQYDPLPFSTPLTQIVLKVVLCCSAEVCGISISLAATELGAFFFSMHFYTNILLCSIHISRSELS